MREAILVIISIILAVLIAVLVMVIIIANLVNKYVDKNAVERIDLYDSLNKNVKNCDVCFLGDSITEFYEIGEFFHDVNPINRGIAADTTLDVLKRLDSNVIAIQPKRLFLQIGTNDIMAKRKLDDIVSSIIEIIERLQKGVEGIKLHVISLYPVNIKAFPYSRIFVRNRKNKDIMYINSKLEEYCKTNNLIYIDIFPHLLDEKGNLKVQYTVEGLHISFDGYEVISNILSQYINEK